MSDVSREALQRGGGVRMKVGEHRRVVRHVDRDVELGLHASLPRARDELDPFIVQALGATNLHEQGREACELGRERRDARVVEGDRLCEVPRVLVQKAGATIVAALVRLAGWQARGQIEPRRDQRRGAGLRHGLLAQPQLQTQREVAAAESPASAIMSASRPLWRSAAYTACASSSAAG